MGSVLSLEILRALSIAGGGARLRVALERRSRSARVGRCVLSTPHKVNRKNMPHQTTTAEGFTLSDDPERFDLRRAHGWIDRSYWARGIPFEVFAKACANSLLVGAYLPDGTQVGMVRVVTDRASFAWICDVIVDEAHRGAGIGKSLMGYLKLHPDLQNLRRMHLVTRDAHGLYSQFGFGPLTGADLWMEIRDLDAYHLKR